MSSKQLYGKELKEALKALDIESMCQEKSRDEVFETIRDMCGDTIKTGFAYLFYHFCTAEEILRYVIGVLVDAPLSNINARESLLRINDLIRDYIQYGATEKYFIRINDDEGIKRLENKHLVRLRDLLVTHLEALEEVNNDKERSKRTYPEY